MKTWSCRGSYMFFNLAVKSTAPKRSLEFLFHCILQCIQFSTSSPWRCVSRCLASLLNCEVQKGIACSHTHTYRVFALLIVQNAICCFASNHLFFFFQCIYNNVSLLISSVFTIMLKSQKLKREHVHSTLHTGHLMRMWKSLLLWLKASRK
jgi:hypothetical protein